MSKRGTCSSPCNDPVVEPKARVCLSQGSTFENFASVVSCCHESQQSSCRCCYRTRHEPRSRPAAAWRTRLPCRQGRCDECRRGTGKFLFPCLCYGEGVRGGTR